MLAVAFVLRAGWGIGKGYLSGDLAALEFPDEQQYWLMANSVHAGEGLRDEFGFRATRMPLYPAMLSLFCGLPYGVVLAKVCHWAMGAAVAALTFSLAGAITTQRIALIAGLIVACDPFLVLSSSLLLTETPFLIAILLLWRLAWTMSLRDSQPSWGRWLLLGLLGSLTVYLRESGAGLFAALLILVMVCRWFDWRALAGACLAVCVVVVSLVPWAARNHSKTGDWCWLTHRAGISLYDGVGPQADGSSDLKDVQQMPAVTGLNGAEWNRYFLRKSYESIRENPARLVGLAWAKMKRMWNPLPNVETYQSPSARLVAGAWSIPIFALALAGMWILPRMTNGVGWRATAFLLLPAVYLSILHCVFVGSIRYRLTAMPMLEILAAATIANILAPAREEEPKEAGNQNG